MVSRCTYKGDTNYQYYGGRGIDICDEWKNDFQTFRGWAVDNGYSDELTIDRINTEKGYSPNNCRWVTMTVQNINTRKAHLITVRGITMCLTHWSRAIGKSHATLVKVKDKAGYISRNFPEKLLGYYTEIQGEKVFIWTGESA